MDWFLAPVISFCLVCSVESNSRYLLYALTDIMIPCIIFVGLYEDKCCLILNFADCLSLLPTLSYLLSIVFSVDLPNRVFSF